jgi:hypothetical protein
MIIVEGGDNVGKSTLVKQLLALDARLHLLKRERFKPWRGETIGQSYLQALTPPSGNPNDHAWALADRFFASECIYGRLFRDGCRMTAHQHFQLKALLISYNALVVFCDPPDSVIEHSWMQREQLYDSPLKIAHAYRRYLVELFYPLPVIRYDWTNPNSSIERYQILQQHCHRVHQVELALQWPHRTCTEATLL